MDPYISILDLQQKLYIEQFRGHRVHWN